MMHQRARGVQPRRFDPTLLLAFVLPVFAWAPLTYPGYFVLRSGFLPIFNLADRLAHLGDIAWMPVVGRGYSLIAGEGGLPYLLAALPAALGAGNAGAVKWIFGLSLVAGSAGAYAWTKSVLRGGWPALVAAAVFILNPITLSCVYVRGAFAEAVLLGILPWLLWAAGDAASGRLRGRLLLALLTAVAVWTYPIMGLVFLLAVLAYVLALHFIKGATLSTPAALLALAGGLFLGVLGLLPVILQRGLGAATWPEPNWSVLLVPWLAMSGGWIAGRLGATLSESTEKAALFAALIGIVLIAVYGDLQPASATGLVPSAPLAIFGENEIALLSVQIEGTPGPGGRVAVDVEWQALEPLTRDYTVFFHVLAGSEQRYGQLDTMPQDGKKPTTQWLPGEVVRDRYEAIVSSDAPIGPAADAKYRYWLGWYLGETGQRLTVREFVPQRQDDKYIVEP